MTYLLQPFSLGTSESIEDAFIAPPDNIQESRDAMEEAERSAILPLRLSAYTPPPNDASWCSSPIKDAQNNPLLRPSLVALQAYAIRRFSALRNHARVGPQHAGAFDATSGAFILRSASENNQFKFAQLTHQTLFGVQVAESNCIRVHFFRVLCRAQSSTRRYDEEMLRRIYAALSSFKGSREPYITGRIFLEAYMKRRRELVAVLESARGELDSADMMLQQAESHLANLSLDPSGVLAEDSKLTAQIASLQNLNSGSPAASNGDVFKVHLECQQQVIETAAARVEDGKCFFNEVFSFEISSREGDLRICLVKIDPLSGAEELVGDCSVLLEDLADQKKRELIKEIWGHAGEILLSCQWIFSKRALYEQYLQEFTVRREAKIRELSDYQEELDKLNKPFCSVDAAGGGICGWFYAVPEVLSRQMEDLRTYLKLPGWLLTSQYVVALTFLLSSIAGYSRAVFLDQCIVAFLFWNNVDPKRWTLSRYSFLMVACILGVAFDLWWLRIYFTAWSLGSVEADMHDITKIFTIFLCIWKIALFFVNWKCRHELLTKVVYGDRVNSTACAYASGRPLNSIELAGYTGSNQVAASAAAALPLMKASHDIAAGAPLFMPSFGSLELGGGL
ncbi:hypothetical protein ACSSS7_006301 [Eimeria intestinalis]